MAPPDRCLAHGSHRQRTDRGGEQPHKRVKRGAFGFANYRIPSLLYAGKPNWSLLGVVSPS